MHSSLSCIRHLHTNSAYSDLIHSQSGAQWSALLWQQIWSLHLWGQGSHVFGLLNISYQFTSVHQCISLTPYTSDVTRIHHVYSLFAGLHCVQSQCVCARSIHVYMHICFPGHSVFLNGAIFITYNCKFVILCWCFRFMNIFKDKHNAKHCTNKNISPVSWGLPSMHQTTGSWWVQAEREHTETMSKY